MTEIRIWSAVKARKNGRNCTERSRKRRDSGRYGPSSRPVWLPENDGRGHRRRSRNRQGHDLSALQQQRRGRAVAHRSHRRSTERTTDRNRELKAVSRGTTAPDAADTRVASL